MEKTTIFSSSGRHSKDSGFVSAFISILTLPFRIVERFLRSIGTWLLVPFRRLKFKLYTSYMVCCLATTMIISTAATIGYECLLTITSSAGVRQGVMAFLETQDDIEVVGAAACGKDAVSICAEFAPDVVLMDLVMPTMDGVEATRGVKQVSPRSQIIVQTSYHDDEHILPAIRSGALSYLLKDVTADELGDAIRKASLGEVTMHPHVAIKMVAAIQRGESERQRTPDLHSDLTGREMDVLMLVAEGLPNAIIAERLFISEKTVKSHVGNILSKLHLNDRTQAAVYAWRSGVISDLS